jgi:hypothetical protein
MRNNEWLEFEDMCIPHRKTKSFVVRNKINRTDLGVVEWDTAWRQYIFVPLIISLKFGGGCLREIADFIDKLMQERKK